MKKFYTLFTALFFALFSFMSYAQGSWNFNGSNDIWESTGTAANLTSGASFSTLDVNSAGNPMLRTFSANINASAVTHAVITLKNNTANKHMRVFYQTTGTIRYVNVAITANDVDFVSYYVDMAGNADWTGTVNELTFQFRENSSYNSALNGTIDIDNIEMTSSDLGVNMVNNTSFENWVDDTEATPVDPVGFYKHESVERSSDSHSGDYSIKVIAASTRDLAQTVNEITAGATYRVSINYKIEANTGSGVRLWSTWKDASNANLASSDLQPTGYLNTVSSEWATFSVDAVAPENATKMNFEVRAYGGATVYWDSFSVSKVQEPDPCAGVTGAPAIADDFEGNSVDILEYAGDNDATFATVDGAPFGSTSNVLQYVDNGGQYANIQLRTCNKFDMAVTNFFTMDVYIDGSSLTGAQANQVSFKLQDKSLAGNAWETQVAINVPITAVDTWQTVEFDFIASSDRTDFDQVVIQFNGENNNDQVIAYIDNLVSSTSPEPDPCDGVTGAPAIADDFEGNSVDILEYAGDNDATFATVDGAPFGSTSNVLQYVDNGGQYANIQLRTCNKFDMAVTNFFTMDVYIDGSSLTGAQANQVSFKLQDKSLAGNAWETQVAINVPITAVDTWQTVEFDFIASSDRTDFDQVVIQFNGENNNDQVIAYIDNLVSSTSPEPDPCDGVTGAPAIADDFEGNSVDILEYAGDNDATFATVDGAPFGSTSNVLQYVDNGGQYANIQLRTCNKFDMAVTNFFTMDVYIDGSSLTGAQANQVSFKLQDKSLAGNAWETQVAINVPITAVDTWQTVEFDFIASSDRTDFDQVVIQFNGENNNDQVIAYIDNLVSTTSVADTTPPVIELVGANPQELTVGDAYVELGATATDDTDDDTTLTAAIVIDATAVDTATAGSYSVTYNVSDAAGNAATEVTRTVTVEAATVSGPPCTHTLVMSDEYDDTWNGASVDILVNGTVVASTTGPANGVADDTLTFDAASGDTISLDNWSSGDYDGEISWAILDGEGTSIATGVYGGGTAGAAAYCTPPPPCPHTLVMSDEYDDTWNGASVDILVNGAVVASTTGPANGVADDTLAFDAASGDSITLGDWVSGDYDGEISWAILDGAGTSIATGVYGGGADAVTGYCPSCLDPTDLAVSDITTTSASVSWTANNGETAWEYQVVESGVEPNATGDATSDNPLELTLLTANTTYDVYVRANCGDGVTSAWVMVSFTTPLTTQTSFPYCSSFDTDLGDWSTEVTQGTSNWESASSSNNFVSAYSGGGSAYYYSGNFNGDSSVLISRPMDITALASPQVTFQIANPSWGADQDVLEVWYKATAADAWSVLGTYSDATTTFSEVTLNLPNASNDYYIAFNATSGYGYGVLIDDVCIAEAPSCIDPTDLTVSNITTTTASVSWTANSGESAWEYQVVASEATPAETGDATSDNPLELTLLTANTTYDVYVRANCDADGTSEWVTVSFTTLPAPIVPDYTNDFTTFPGEFWSEGTGALNVGPTGSTSSWYDDGFVSGSTGSAAINLYDLRDSWLISPMFDLSNGTFFLNVDAAATEYNTQSTDAIFGADDFVTLMASTDGGSTWVELHRWDASNNPGYTGTGWTEITLNNYTATSKFAIYGESTTSAEDIDFFVDNFRITSSSLGVEDNSISLFSYFPNPVNNVLSIKAQASIDSITVYNMLGQTVVRSTPNTTTTAVDMSGLQTGAYFVQVAINNSIETVRVIKN